MAKYHLDPPLVPRNGQMLRMIGITRISTLNQDIKSLDEQKALIATCGRFLQQGGICHG